MIPMKELPTWEPGEERANTITHAIGCVFSVGALIAIIVQQILHYDKYKMIGMLIYGVCMNILYFVSTFYHGLTNPKWKKIFRYGDHCSIYLLIAGSYAPYCLTILRESNGIVVLSVIWSIAIVGIFLKIMWFDIVDTISLLFYIVMGWVIIMTLNTLVLTIKPPCLYFLFALGVFYTLGTVFFARDDEIPYAHAIWHLFVLAGSISTFISTFFYL